VVAASCWINHRLPGKWAIWLLRRCSSWLGTNIARIGEMCGTAALAFLTHIMKGATNRSSALPLAEQSTQEQDWILVGRRTADPHLQAHATFSSPRREFTPKDIGSIIFSSCRAIVG